MVLNSVRANFHRPQRGGPTMTMEYKGYTANPIDFDPEEETFSGVCWG